MGKKKVGNFMINQDNVIGKGQFGTVCTAAKIDNEEIVAVKIIEKQKSTFHLTQLMKMNTTKML